MKAKRILFLTMSVVMLLATLMTSVAQAAPSPIGATVALGSTNLKKAELIALKSETIERELDNRAEKYAEEMFANDPEFEGGYEMVKLVTAELRVVITGNQPAKVKMNVAGAKVGARIFVVIKLPNGKTTIAEATVLANGEIEFEVTGNCSISIVEVKKKGESVAPAALPATSNR